MCRKKDLFYMFLLIFFYRFMLLCTLYLFSSITSYLWYFIGRAFIKWFINLNKINDCFLPFFHWSTQLFASHMVWYTHYRIFKKNLIYLHFSFQEHGIDYLESFRGCEFNISRQFYYCEQQTLEIFKHTALYRYLGMSIFRFWNSHCTNFQLTVTSA